MNFGENLVKFTLQADDLTPEQVLRCRIAWDFVLDVLKKSLYTLCTTLTSVYISLYITRIYTLVLHT